jgi:hypothetical protein
MSIRNKRLTKEKLTLDKFKLQWQEDWTQHDPVIIKTIQKNVYISIEVDLKYPFHNPTLYVHKNKKMSYIEWFVKLKTKNKDLESLIHIPCVCCKNINCYWVPTYGIESIINDFIEFQNYFETLDKFRIIYKKINGFDDLIYKNIILTI